MNNKSKLIIASIASVGLLLGAGVPVLAASRMGHFKMHSDTTKYEARAQQDGAKQSRVTSGLDRAIEKGKITSDQKAQILAKIDEIHNFRETLKDLPETQRKQAMDAKRNEIKQWASDNDVPIGMFLRRHK